MKRMIIRLSLTILLIAFPVWVAAFGLGGIEVSSSLNAPLKAQIPLISVSEADVIDAKVKLASPEAFTRAGIDRPFHLTQLRFKPEVTQQGDTLIRISSRQGITEPYLNFLLEVQLRGQSLVREYTILLDPPVYQPPAVKTTVGRTASATTSQTRASVSQYGPVKAGESLWVIASDLRPNQAVSVEQMMLALQRKNPQAFNRGNVNLLRRGAVLDIPSTAEAQQMSPAAARSEFRRQTQEWKQQISRKSEIAAAAPVETKQRQITTQSSAAPKVAETEVTQAPVDTEESPLKVVPAGAEVIADGVDRKGYPTSTQEELQESIADSKENLQAVQDINKDIAELKTALEDKMVALRSALEEKDQAIADLKQRLQVAETETGKPGTSDAVSMGEGTKESDQSSLSAEASASAEPVQAPVAVAKPTPMRPWWEDPKWVVIVGFAALIIVIVIMLMLRDKKKPTQAVARAEPMAPETHPQVAAVTKPQSMESGREQPQSSRSKPEETPVEEQDSFLRELFEDEPLDNLDDQDEAQIKSGGEVVSSVLTETDIYLAYRRYGQAESMVNEALESHPGSAELKAKKLEIYAFKRDKSAFTTYLDQVGPALVAADPELWARVVEMGQSLAPEHPMFSDTLASASDDSEAVSDRVEVSEATEEQIVVDGDASMMDTDNLDIDLDISVDDLIVHHDEVAEDSADDALELPREESNDIPSLDIDLEFDEDDLKDKG